MAYMGYDQQKMMEELLRKQQAGMNLPSQQMLGGIGTDVQPQQQAGLTGAQQAQLLELENAPFQGMGDLMKAETPTWGTALAKTLAAGYLGKKGRERRKKEGTKLTKAMEKDANLTATELARVRGMEDEKLDFLRSGESRKKAQEERDITTFSERGVQDKEFLFRATEPELTPGTAEYGNKFAKFLEEQDTRYGMYGSRGGGGRLPSAGIQKYEQWVKLNPDATDQDKRDEYNKILSSYRTVDFADVDTFVGTGDNVIDEKSDVIRETVVQQEKDVAEGTKAGTLSAESYAYAQEQLNEMETDIGTLQTLIDDEDFDGAVGYIDAITGGWSEDFAYFGDEGKLGARIELVVNNMVLRQADFLKGNLNVQELTLLMDSVPKRSSDEELWKSWFKDYKLLYEKAKRSALKKQSSGQAMFDKTDEAPQQQAPDGIIWID